MSMFSKRFGTFMVLALSLVFRGPLAQPALASVRTPADVYVDYSLRLLDQTDASLPFLTQAANAVAERLVAGGKLYIGGSQQAFAAEGCYRAGGLMLLQSYQPNLTLGPLDTVLIGSVGSQPQADLDLIRTLRQQGVVTVAFGSPQAKALGQEADFFISNNVVDEAGIIRLTAWDQPICPLASVMNVVNLWVFTGELVAALTRCGQMPTMFQSVMSPGGKERNEKFLPTPFHTDRSVPPVAPAALGRSYLAALRKYLILLQATQGEAIRKAAAKVGQARAAGHTAHAVLVGHYVPAEIGRAGDPGLFQAAPAKGQPEEPLPGIQPGDVILYIGYTWLPLPLLRGAKEAGATTIAAIAQGEGWAVPTDLIDIYIDPQWKLGDAAVEVPGYDLHILPPSGVVQSIIYWCISAEAALHKKIRRPL